MGKYIRINKKTIIAIIIIIIILLILFWNQLFPSNGNEIPPPPPSTMHKDIFYATNAIGGEVVNFPIRVHIDQSFVDFWSRVNEKHNYFMFTDSNNNVLNVEIVKWDYNNKDAIIYVCLPTLSTSSIINLLSGGDIIGNLGDSSKVWDDNYVFVSHMDDYQDTAHIINSKNGLIGTKYMSDHPKAIDGSQYFDGVNDYISFAGNGCMYSSFLFTIEIKFKSEDLSSSKALLNREDTYYPFVYLLSVSSTGEYFGFRFPSSGGGLRDISGNIPLSTNRWYYITATDIYRSSDAILWMQLWVDNAFTQNTYGPYPTWPPEPYCGGQTLTIGRYAEYSISNGSTIFKNFFKGYIDEIRISKVSRDENWIKKAVMSELETLGSWIHYPS